MRSCLHQHAYWHIERQILAASPSLMGPVWTRSQPLGRRAVRVPWRARTRRMGRPDAVTAIVPHGRMPSPLSSPPP